MKRDEARAYCMEVFNDSAAMPGNEQAMELALDEFERAVRVYCHNPVRTDYYSAYHENEGG